ncbi:uncharacterized protein LOC129231858 [Uloborus diversus]|uniref:uncharacterized protein LOC129231858 n=1 Tax=Uloborus diversus TaxID=327109 RepID=UPI00240977CB|nr:uncharacterized protein LOC129231858 [Uloborus diversus]
MVESMDNSFLADENTSLVTDMSLEEDCQEGGALPNQLPAADPVEDVGVGSPRPELPELEPVAGPSNQEDSVAPQVSNFLIKCCTRQLKFLILKKITSLFCSYCRVFVS